jgi:ectoine hydroxylase-related dioxygenase (phytanoyl-CoA dioxygenase family)
MLAERGWVVVRQAVDRARVAELVAAVDAITAASPPVGAGLVFEVAGVSRVSPPIAGHTHDAAIARHAAQALACAAVQLLQDTVLVKDAQVGGEVAWHQDHTYTGYLSPARAVSVRLALTDETVETGCLEVIDGSHHWGLLGDVRALTEASVADALGERARDWADKVVRLELAPGDLSIHHCLTLHKSGPNVSAQPRKTLITRVFDAQCRLIAERLPPGAAPWFPTDGDGRLSEASFPILYRGG